MTALLLLKHLFLLSESYVNISPLFLYNNMFLNCSEKTTNCAIATLKTANLVLEKICFKEHGNALVSRKYNTIWFLSQGYLVELIHRCENLKRSVIYPP